MDGESKLEIFKREINLILTSEIRSFVKAAIQTLPDYFFEIPASSTGKYHPQYALGSGGLVRHTQAAVRICWTLLGTKTFGGKYNQRDKDMMLAALILHDGLKSGYPKQKYTASDHPMLVCEHVEKNLAEHGDLDVMIGRPYREIIYDLIRSHMGEWNTDKDGKEIMPKPSSAAQGMVHLADYLASRKMFEFNFDV